MTHQELPEPPIQPPGVQNEADKLLTVLAEDMHEYAIFSLDAEGRVASWNAGAERMKGYRSAEIIGRHFSQFYLPEQVESGYPDWELAQAAANGFYIDHGWRLRKDGTRFWAHVVITAQRTSSGELDGFIKVIRDDTEVQARRQRSQRRFTDLLRIAPVGIALFDDFDHVLDTNRALSEMLGYRPRELYGMSAAELLHPSDQGEGIVTLSSQRPGASPAIGRGGPHRVLTRSDGQRVHCQVHREPSVQDDGTRFWIVSFQDITNQVLHAQNLHYQATHDEATGLLNRQGAKEFLASLLCGDLPEQIAVLFCDLDNFKRVNDSLGHEAGDELLSALAKRLVDQLPAACTPARLYGDEFLIICSDVTSCGGLEAIADVASDLLHATLPVRGQMVNISASIGAAAAEGPSTTAEELFRRADAAMFESKAHSAGNESPPYATLARPGTDQLALEEELRNALLNDGLRLHYQPIVDCQRSVVLAEALVRWPHAEHGLIAPNVILSVAEQGGLLRDLDRWVMRTAMREAASWPAQGDRPVRITVNLSALHPAAVRFTQEVTTAIEDSGIVPERVVLEMVETALVDLPREPRKVMDELTTAGIQFAMDDFGTGYSSLARLKDLPTQIIKLDRRFIAGMGVDPADLGITRAVVELARALERTCIAEGVETTAQYHLLRDLGVDAYQGYLFSPPVPAEEFRELLGRSPLPLPDR